MSDDLCTYMQYTTFTFVGSHKTNVDTLFSSLWSIATIKIASYPIQILF